MRFSQIKLSMFSATENSFPSLRGKAAEIRHLAAPLAHTFRSMCDPANQHHKVICAMLQIAVRLEELLEQNRDAFRLPAADAQEWGRGCQAFVQMNTQLAHHYHSQGLFLFHHTIKFHYMLHLGMLGTEINPRRAWCYAGEDLMHRTKVIVQTCLRGTPGHLVVPKAMTKYAFGLGISMEENIWKA